MIDWQNKNRLVWMALFMALSAIVSAQESSSPVVEQVTFSPRSAELSHRIVQELARKGESYVPRTVHLREDGTAVYTNRLILEDSPYLIQHAHNPVDWYPWGDEAFERARRENKPVFLSIGYSTCHWCHVMEKESFENAAIADLLNRHFVPVKVDRERRPDVDETYMTAVTLLTRRGGWPMSSFLTPEGKPFFGGTYFRPDQFETLLMRVNSVWAERQEDLLLQADQVAAAVAEVNRNKRDASEVDALVVDMASREIMASHDRRHGGFGLAPKFPQEPLLFLLLAVAERSGNLGSLEVLENTLDAMARGGIYDQVAGGFHRYATDPRWLIPHFEKMLYNQAHLARVFVDAWRLTGKPSYRRTAVQILDYVLRDLTSPQGAFYSATDADSAGGEGTFFVWTPAEIREALSVADAALAMELFAVTDKGNFEGANILHLPKSLAEFAEQKKLPLETLHARVDRIRTQLYRVRQQRERPLRDEKIITAWNGMMISALSLAGMALGEPRYTRAAQLAAEFIWQHNRHADNDLWRVNLEGRASILAQQSDYAYYAEGLLSLYDATGEQVWLQRAQTTADAMLRHFWDDDSGGFFMSRSEEQVTSMSRPRDGGQDNAIPSGNSVALRVLQMLAARTGNREYDDKAQHTIAAFSGSLLQHPRGFGYMLTAVDNLMHGEMGPVGYAANGGVRLTANRTGPDQVTVQVDIPAGWHINSNAPLQKGLIPTTLTTVENTRGWSITDVDYPDAETLQLGFQRQPLSLYKGDITIRAELESAESAIGILPLQVGVQACNDRVCLPPERVRLHVPMAQLSATH